MLIHRRGRTALRTSSAALAASSALLLVLLAICAVLGAPAQHAAAAPAMLRVPGDAVTIQEAIDKAHSGQEIQVRNGVYQETLFISKTLKLTGGWNDDFSLQNSISIVDANFNGRALTVQPLPSFPLDAAASLTPTVVVSQFAFTRGTAQGLGGALLPEVPRLPGLPDIAAGDISQATAPFAPSPARIAELRAELHALAASGSLPGGDAALQGILRRLDAAQGPVSQEFPQPAAPSAVTQFAAPFAPAAPLRVDCGGGIFVRAAYLHLDHVEVFSNAATGMGPSTAGGVLPYGAGGGICAVDLPTGGLRLERTIISRNVASGAGVKFGAGFGGGLFVGRGMPLAAGITASSAAPVTGTLIVENVRIANNDAAYIGAGYGGGVFVTAAPGASFDLAMFTENYATHWGTLGYGGGLFVGDSPAVTLPLGGFEGNTAANTLETEDPQEWVIGEGGGIYLYRSADFSFGSEQGQRSLFVGNLGALRGVGNGGALASLASPGLHIAGSEFLGNWGAIYVAGQGDFAGGGALFLSGSDRSRIEGSEFADNVVGVFNLQGSRLSGGALNAGNVENFLIDNNIFRSNAGGTSSGGGLASGGAVGISRGRFVTVTNSEFRDNAADLGLSGGVGGGLYLQLVEDVLVQNNQFLRNRGGSGAGIGGGLTVEGSGDALLWPQDPLAQGTQDVGGINRSVTVAANTFTANQAAETSRGEADLGGALAVNSTAGLVLHNNVLAGNQALHGAAMALFGYGGQTLDGLAEPSSAAPPLAGAEVANNTLFNNGGQSGIYAEMWTTPLTFTNNVVVSHTVGIALATNAKTGGVVAAAAHNLYNDNAANSVVDQDSKLEETAVLTGPVAFVEPWQGDFHLQVQSAAIDAADPRGIPPAPNRDRDGQLRPYRLAVDVGAYEWRGPLNFLPTVRKQACTVTPHVGWALGENSDGSGSAILRTLDGGLTWTRQYTASVVLSGLDVVDTEHVWVSGDGGTLLSTADGGATWQKQAPPANLPAGARINRVTAVDAQRAWASATVFPAGGGNTGYILYTADGGSTWSVQTSLPVQEGFISWIAAGDASNIWAAGGYTAALAEAVGQEGSRTSAASGFILHSGDGGMTWQMQAETDSIVIGLDADGPELVWGAGRYGAYRTLNGGAQWSFYNIFPTDANHVDAVDGGHVWVAGDNFTVLYTGDGLDAELPLRAWQDRSPAGLRGKVAYAVDFIDAENGWIAGGNFGPSPGGVIATTCNGGLVWETQQWSEYDPIRAIDMAPAGE